MSAVISFMCVQHHALPHHRHLQIHNQTQIIVCVITHHSISVDHCAIRQTSVMSRLDTIRSSLLGAPSNSTPFSSHSRSLTTETGVPSKPHQDVSPSSSPALGGEREIHSLFQARPHCVPPSPAPRGGIGVCSGARQPGTHWPCIQLNGWIDYRSPFAVTRVH